MSSDSHWDDVVLLLNFDGSDNDFFKNNSDRTNGALSAIQSFKTNTSIENISTFTKKFGYSSFFSNGLEASFFGFHFIENMPLFCFEAWIYKTDNSRSIIFCEGSSFLSFYDHSTYGNYGVKESTNGFSFYIEDGGAGISGYQTNQNVNEYLKLDKWNHIRLTYDYQENLIFNKAKLYVDGTPVPLTISANNDVFSTSINYFSSGYTIFGFNNLDETVVAYRKDTAYYDSIRITTNTTRADELNANGTLTVPTAAYPIMSSTGIVSGVVKIGGTVASDKNVRLYKKDTGEFVKEMLSARNGSFSFNNLPNDKEYFVVIHDTSGTYNAVVSDSLITLPFVL
jgi:hypothetical protein